VAEEAAPMSDLAAFLLARIDDDETAAKEAGANVWTEQSSCVLDTGEWPDGVHALGDSRVTRFIAEHDPARVLAECDTKRRIIDLHASLPQPPMLRAVGNVCAECSSSFEDGHVEGVAWPCDTLRLLALPYADHPDYREEWKP